MTYQRVPLWLLIGAITVCASGCGASAAKQEVSSIMAVESSVDVADASENDIETEEVEKVNVELPIVLEGAMSYADYDAIREEIRQQMIETLIADGTIQTEEDLFVYEEGYVRKDIPEIIQDWEELIEQNLSFLFFSLDENGIPVLYNSTAACMKYQDSLYVTEMDHWDTRKITSGTSFREIEDRTCESIGETWYRFLFVFERSIPISEIMECQTKGAKENLQKKMEQNGFAEDDLFREFIFASIIGTEKGQVAAEKPEEMVKAFFHLENVVSSEVVPNDMSSDAVRVQFEDGSSFSCVVDLYNRNVLDKKYYIPTFAAVDFDDKKAFYGEMQQVDFAKLKEIEQNGEIYYDMFDMESWDGGYGLISLDTKRDAALYLNSDGNAHIVRIKDRIVPIYMFAGRSEPQWIMQDLNQDGKEEYALIINTGWGTGCYWDALCVVQENGEVSVFQDLDVDVLTNSIKSQYEKETGILQYWLEVDGEKSCQGEIQIEPSDDPEHVCTGLSYGDINRIYYEDDTLWLEASGGVTYADWATPQYEQEVVCKGKIDMDSMGRLTVKDIEFIETE